MSFSQEPFRANTLNPNEPIGEEDLAYFRQRMKNHAFQEIMRLFVECAEKNSLTKSNIASKLGKDKSQISRMFACPTNWTIDTLSDLSLALGYEASVIFENLDEDPRHNFIHPLTEPNSSSVVMKSDITSETFETFTQDSVEVSING